MRSGLLLIFRLFNRLQKFYPQMFESYSHRKNKNLLFSVCFDYGEQGPTLPDADAREMRVRYGYEYEYIGVESHANGRGWRRTRAPRVAGSLSPGCYWENPGIGRPNRQWYVLRVLSSLGD